MSHQSPYTSKPPSVQGTLDLFRGEWACRMPQELGAVTAGKAGAFDDDPRVPWAIEQFKGFGLPIESSHVLELGPLEGAHTWQLSNAGALSVTSIESHERAFLKCLVVKELLGIQRVNFLYGDAIEYLKANDRQFDICFASGILYHLANPVELIELASRWCRGIFLWTHYWDPEFNARHPQAGGGRGEAQKVSHACFEHTLHHHEYGSRDSYSTFWGGSSGHANWMERDEILHALSFFGFRKQVPFLEVNPEGSVIRIAAAK
jgi:hypothetical protein